MRVQPPRSTPSPPNPATLSRGARKRPSPQEYIDGILRGDRAILAQAITLVESTRTADTELAEEILEKCYSRAGHSIRVGITGVPGAGKSSVIEVLGMHLIRERGENVAILAIDPSSQVSGGSILGDKTRMGTLAASDKAFIRPSPAKGSLGGVARKTREAMLLCEASGYKNIIVETVGVGQSETAVREMVDFFLLLLLPGAGDELQGMKRGVMEMADCVAINKSDGTNIDAANRARADAEHALHYFPRSNTGWAPRAQTCSAQTGKGIAELWSCVLEYVNLTHKNGAFERVRREQMRRWMLEMIQQAVMKNFQADPAVRNRMAALEQDVAAGSKSAFRAAREVLGERFTPSE